LTGKHTGTTSATMRQQVEAARAAQARRTPDGTPNARLDSKRLNAVANLSDSCLLLMKQAMDELGSAPARTTRSDGLPGRSQTSTAPNTSANTTSLRRFSIGCWIENFEKPSHA
jgi:hypothetical protein